jgi:hypothetical protein
MYVGRRLFLGFWRLDFVTDLLKNDGFRVEFYLPSVPDIDYFTGRESSMMDMEKALFPIGPRRKVIFLHGLGGIGKTQMAIHFAKKHRDEYSAVLWFDAKNEDTLRQSFQSNARRLPNGGVPQSLLDNTSATSDLQKLVEAVKQWLARPQNQKWLLIFDNHDNPKISQNSDKFAYNILPYFPEADRGSIIITTRWRSFKIGEPVSIEKLPKDTDDSLKILVKTSRRADLGEGMFCFVLYT